jgi:hypothetical protein
MYPLVRRDLARFDPTADAAAAGGGLRWSPHVLWLAIKWKKLVEFRRSELPAGSVGDVNSPSRLKQHAGLCHCKDRAAPRRFNDLTIF